MMKKDTVFDFLTHIMVVWGISVLSFCIFCPVFGESAREVSSIFRLGNTGIAVETLLQFLLLAILITVFRWLLFTDKLVKKFCIALRTAFMFAGTIAVVVIEAAVFGWFPMNQTKPWIMFLLSFVVCAVVSICISVVKEKSENRRMQDALERLKSEEDKQVKAKL